MQNTGQDVGLPAGALRTARNVLLDDDGTVDSAPGVRLIQARGQVHSLWQSQGGESYCGAGQMLCRATSAGLIDLLDTGSAGPFAFADLNGEVVAATRAGLFHLRGDEALALALPTPGFSAVPVASGGLRAGRYGVAITVRRGGEESGLSRMRMVEVGEGGGIQLQLPDGTHDEASIYRTEANGSTLYRAASAPQGLTTFVLGVGQLGAMPGTAYLDPLPGGHLLAQWNGRLLLGDGRTLRYSAPLRYGLHDRRRDFLQFSKRLRMILPVQDGVYVADSHNTYFLAGTDPEQWRQIKLSASPPPEGCAAVLDGALFDGITANRVAVWLSGSGFVLGLPEGQVVQPQAKRLRLPRSGAGTLAVHDRRLFALAR